MPSNSRIKEALALASKVSEHPATVAELCWSDDPDYITGYVAGKKLGYQRITAMKEYGTEEGCRIFFADGSVNVNTYINDLEKQPILIEWEEDDDSRFDRKSKKHLWLPFTQMKDYDEHPLIIESGNGIKVKDINGKEYYDGFSSVWLNVHGHRKRN